MILGIDFGTTYTLVSWYENDQLNFFEFDGNIFLPTKINNTTLLKTKLAQNQNDSFKNVADFFKKLNSMLEKKFKKTVFECIITAPVRFNDVALNKIKTAAIQANFYVLKILMEPVAAACYALKEKHQNGYYLIYDLGGGTFDLSLIKLHQDVFQVISVNGIENFGGSDIDKKIAQNLNCNLIEAEKYKISGEFSKEIEELIQQELQKTFEMTLNLAKNYKINKLILAGGSSKLEHIYNHFSKTFNIYYEKNVDTLICAGAATYAQFIKNKSNLLIDVAAFDIGIETIGNKMEVLINRNTPLPFFITEKFFPANNEKITINILQGNEKKASECTSLMQFQIQNQKEFELTMMLDIDGILTIKTADEIKIINNAFKKINNNSEYINKINLMLSKIKNIDLNQEQNQLKNHLIQAKNINISKDAFSWLEKKFNSLF